MALPGRSKSVAAASEGVLYRGPRVVAQGGSSSSGGWKALGGFGALLAAVGLVDLALYWFPPSFASPEWEFATVAATMSSLPLPTIGMAALVASLLVRGGPKSRLSAGLGLLLIALLIAAAYALFLLNLPLALTAASGPQGPAITRAIIRTSVMAVGLGSGYLVAAIALLRNLPNGSHG